MNLVDLAIIAAVAFNVWSGVKVGFVMGVYQLVTLVVVVVASIALQKPVGEAVAPRLPVGPEISRLVVYVVILTGLGFVFGLIGSRLLGPVVRRLRSSRVGGGADRILGLVPGVLRGVVYAGSITFIARLVLPEGNQWRELVDASTLAPFFVAIFERVYPFPQPVI